MLKRIDRYVSRAFVVRFVAANVIVLGLYMSFDAVKRLDQVRAESFRDAVSKLFDYYLYQAPVLTLDLSPALLLLAAGLLVVQMGRSGELLVLKASGVSLQRAFRPMLVLSLVVAALIYWTREDIVPACYKQRELLDREMGANVVERFFLTDARHGFKMFVGRYDFAMQSAGEPGMSNITIMDFYPSHALKTVAEAELGHWGKDGDIILEKVTVQTLNEQGAPTGKPSVWPSKVLKTSLTPYDFVREERQTMATSLPSLTLRELHERAVKYPNVPQFRVMFHARIAATLVPLVLLLLGIPLLLGSEQTLSSRLLGGVVCILVAAGYHVLSFVCISMGNTGILGPVAAAWLPVVAAAPPGLWFYSTMRT